MCPGNVSMFPSVPSHPIEHGQLFVVIMFTRGGRTVIEIIIIIIIGLVKNI